MKNENNRDYYEVLGVDRTATNSEIKEVYRKLAQMYHPDINKSHAAEDKMKLINEAYEVLSDEIRRQQYDTKWDEKNQQDDTTAKSAPTPNGVESQSGYEDEEPEYWRAYKRTHKDTSYSTQEYESHSRNGLARSHILQAFGILIILYSLIDYRTFVVDELMMMSSKIWVWLLVAIIISSTFYDNYKHRKEPKLQFEKILRASVYVAIFTMMSLILSAASVNNLAVAIYGYALVIIFVLFASLAAYCIINTPHIKNTIKNCMEKIKAWKISDASSHSINPGKFAISSLLGISVSMFLLYLLYIYIDRLDASANRILNGSRFTQTGFQNFIVPILIIEAMLLLLIMALSMPGIFVKHINHISHRKSLFYTIIIFAGLIIYFAVKNPADVFGDNWLSFHIPAAVLSIACGLMVYITPKDISHQELARCTRYIKKGAIISALPFLIIIGMIALVVVILLFLLGISSPLLTRR